MIKSRIALAAALFAAAGAANAAGFTLTPALTSDYDFRGVSQNDESETLQLGLNYAMENGVYIGAWGSEVDFGPGSNATWELDLMAGYTWGDAADGVGYDVGAIFYTYPSSSTEDDIYEVYGGITSGMFNGKLWIAPDIDSEIGVYAEANVAIPVAGFTFGLHAGYSFGDAWEKTNSEHLDYSVGVTKSLGPLDLNLKYVNSNDLADPVGRNAWIGTISTTLPWMK
jgi:uncharacterized protein (TIGR02001 family)